MSTRYEKARAIAEAAANRWDAFGDTAGINWLADAVMGASAGPDEMSRSDERAGAIAEVATRLKNHSLSPCLDCGGQGYTDQGKSACFWCRGAGVITQQMAHAFGAADRAEAAHQQVTAERDDWHAAADSATALNKEAVAMIARLRAEGEAKDRALKILLPFVDYAAGEGLMFRGSDDTDRPDMDAADLCIAAAAALGLELGDPGYCALVEKGEREITALARAATAREGA